MQATGITADASSSVRATMRRVEASVARFSRNDAQDIVQEAMTRAVRHGVDCDAEPWLRVVARRIATDRARRAREIPSEQTEIEHASRSKVSSPEDIVVANESAGVISKALNALPPRYRDALVTYAEDQDHAVVAAHFGISANATWSLLCRARTRLRQELDRVGYAFGMLGVRLNRWATELGTACAVTCIAVGATFLGPVAESAPAIPDVPRSTATVSVSAPTFAAPVVEPAKPVIEPTAAKARRTVATVTAPRIEIARYEVRPCGVKGRPLPVGVHASILEDERKSIVAGLVKKLPEELRTVESLTC